VHSKIVQVSKIANFFMSQNVFYWKKTLLKETFWLVKFSILDPLWWRLSHVPRSLPGLYGPRYEGMSANALCWALLHTAGTKSYTFTVPRPGCSPDHVLYQISKAPSSPYEAMFDFIFWADLDSQKSQLYFLPLAGLGQLPILLKNQPSPSSFFN
jgi:hypothetical protein